MLESGTPTPVVVVHGGAGSWADERKTEAVPVCERAAAAGAKALPGGAIAAVVAAVKVLEGDPLFNAGLGSSLTRAGTIELDAAVMSGDLRFGAITACPPVESAIDLALAVLEDGEHSLLAGKGALAFAESVGIHRLGPDDLVTEFSRSRFEEMRDRPREPSGGTVGAVALDATGRLAAATSTGGIPFKKPGRIGDTPLVGAGTYADDALGGAASATGHGEAIMKVLLCREAVGRLSRGESVENAGRKAMEVFEKRVGGSGGLILLDSKGSYLALRNTAAMPWSACSPDKQPISGS